MGVTSVAAGTQSTTVGTTEHTLATITDAGTYVFVCDASAMINADITEVRIYTKALSGGTSRVAYYAAFAHIQGAPHMYSPPVPIDVEFKATIKQPAGTPHAYPWSILKLG